MPFERVLITAQLVKYSVQAPNQEELAELLNLGLPTLVSRDRQGCTPGPTWAPGKWEIPESPIFTWVFMGKLSPRIPRLNTINTVRVHIR